MKRLLLASLALLSAAPVAAAPNPRQAGLIFREARSICAADGGRFWGRSLCGPMLLVDPTDMTVLANEGDGQGILRRRGVYWVGTLPGDVIVANTAIDWAGKRWTELILPLEPKGTAMHPGWRRVLLAHELFHRIQPGLGLTRPEGANGHLDTLDGRYLLQVEWRALAAALKASTPAARKAAIADALLFRQARYAQFPNAAADESALELDEGVPEYTGVRLGLTTPAERVDYALYDLGAFVDAPTFVRSFAYATGPAYGLLLDQADPAWRGKLKSGRRFDEMLGAALHLPPPALGSVRARARVYDNGALRASEGGRERQRLARMAAYKAKLIDGPVLVLPLDHPSYQFNPQTLVPIGAGTVYPTMKLTSTWGTLTVDGDALLDDAKTRAAVSAAGGDIEQGRGPGWTIDLKPGWHIVPGARAGDYTVTRD